MDSNQFNSTSDSSSVSGHYQYNNCLAIRQEIQRFESVHPSIYAIYDMLDLNSDQVLALRIREHLLSIEDSFVNSQEWTISRNVPDLRLGIVGSLSSGKSALVHRYLTDSYMQDESPEGGRFKKEVFVAGQSNMLLIRDEGGSPELQFSCWVDAVIFVFSAYSLESFETVKKYFQKFALYRPNLDQIPIILVGTQDPFGYSGPPVIEEYHARKLASEMHRNCSYFETWSLSGRNVERVFHEACQRIIQVRGLCNSSHSYLMSGASSVNYSTGAYVFNSRPTTPNAPYNNNNINVNPSLSVAANSIHRDAFHTTNQPTIASNLPAASVVSSSSTSTTSNTPNNNYLNNNFNASNAPRTTNATTFGSLTSPSTSASLSNSPSIPIASDYVSKSPSPTALNKARLPVYISNQSNSLRKMQPLQSNSSANTTNTLSAIPRPSFSAPNSAIKCPPSSNLNSMPTGPVPPRRVESKQNEPPSLSSAVASTPINNNLVTDTVFTPISAIKEQLQQSSSNQNGLPIATGAQMLPPQFAKDKQKENVPKDALTPNPSTPLPSTPQTPSATPNLNRKARRRSNLFPQLSSSKNKNLEEKCRNGELGSGRAIPLRQGYLHKKSYSSALNTKLSLKNKEWKKKYVTLTTDGCLTYHPSLHDYMSDIHGKKINLMHTTVKIPGQKPRGSCSVAQPTSIASECTVDGVRFNGNSANNMGNFFLDTQSNDLAPVDGPLSLNNVAKCSACGFNLDERRLPSTNPTLKDKEKKKHRRVKSSSNPINLTSRLLCERCTLEQSNAASGASDEEEFVFVIVSLDNKQWHFQAASAEDRESWLQAIEQQILNSLQSMQSDKEKSRSNTAEQIDNERAALDRVRQMPGNTFCLECDAPNPSWASLNLGALMCIECSGIHRNLGTHISKVRSLELDDWPQGNLAVMLALGNAAANKIWEFNTKNRSKPVPTSSRDEKEMWIRAKYERKEFLCPLPAQPSIEKQLEQAIRVCNINQVALILGHMSTNAGSSNSSLTFTDRKLTPLHLAAQTGNIPIAQLLIWHFAKINAQDDDGCNAYSHADAKEMEDFLKQQGCAELSTKSVLTNKTKFAVSKASASNENGSLARRSQPLTPTDMFDHMPASII